MQREFCLCLGMLYRVQYTRAALSPHPQCAVHCIMKLAARLRVVLLMLSAFALTSNLLSVVSQLLGRWCRMQCTLSRDIPWRAREGLAFLVGSMAEDLLLSPSCASLACAWGTCGKGTGRDEARGAGPCPTVPA
jgi:hypothetical protein